MATEHPRVRGENNFVKILNNSLIGTSPRARGKLHKGFLALGGVRNIPACAGKTNPAALGDPEKPEHPRVRGENFGNNNFIEKPEGTSPRARGKRPRSGRGWG